jgi:choline dehydrogenase-like flavoprotein
MKSVTVDVVIIGSGAGGGTVAKTLAELARSGKRVLLLEKGPRHDTRTFDGQELAMATRLYASGGAMPVADHTVTLAMTEGLGGSTLVYTGTSVLPSQRVIDGWHLPGVEHADLSARAERFKLENGVHLVPDDELNDNNQLFAKGCRALGWHPERFPVNTRSCQGAGLCNLGCPNNAKQGTSVVQIPVAERAGVEVVTRATVLRLAASGQGGVLDVEVSDHTQPSGPPSEWVPGRYEVHAHTVVLCCGAVQSPALLLRSGLEAKLPAIGRWFTCHPAHILVGEHEGPISNCVGHPKSWLWDERIVTDRYFLEACMYFPFVTAKNMTGFGPEHQSFLEHFERLQMILVLACDDALPDQRVTLDSHGHAVVDYRLTSQTITAMVKATRAASRIFFAGGAKAVHAPSARPTRLTVADLESLDTRIHEDHFKPGSISVSAAHLMGGCRMGTDPKTSVTTPQGQVHGLPWLYVADASLFPTALEINPYLTIMALAEHVAEQVADREHVTLARPGGGVNPTGRVTLAALAHLVRSSGDSHVR